MLIKKEYKKENIVWKRAENKERPRCRFGGCFLYKNKCGGFISDYTEICTHLNTLIHYSYVPIKT